MCMYACMNACMRVCMYVCMQMYVSTYVCIYVCLHKGAFLYLAGQVRPMSSDNAPGSHGACSGQGRSAHDPQKDFSIPSQKHLIPAVN